MSFYFTPYILPSLLSALTNGCLAYYAWQRRQIPAANYLFWLMAGLSGWSFSYALNIASSQLWQKHLLFILGCIFVCVTLLCVLPMVLEVASGSRPPRWLTLLLAVVPVTSVLISVTNPWHGLLGNDMHLVRRADLILLGFTPGPYMKLFHLPYIYLYYLIVITVCLVFIMRQGQNRRSSLFLIVIATMLPVAVEMFSLSPVKEFRLTTSMLLVTGLCYWLAVFRHHLLDLVPVARAALFEQMQEPVLVIDQQNRIAEINRSAVRQLQLSGNTLGRTLGQLFPPGHPLHGIDDPDQPEIRSDQANGHRWQINRSLLTKNNVQLGQILVLHDIGTLYRVQEELRENVERFRRLADESADMVWQLDTDMKFTYINEADRKMRGFTAAEVLGRPASAFLLPKDNELIRQSNMERMRKERQGIRTGAIRYEMQMLCKDGSYIWTEINANPTRGADGTIAGYIGVTRDISGRKADELRIAEALAVEQEARSEMGRFLDLISHEFRTPLAIIQTNINLLTLEDTHSGRQHEPRLDTIMHAVNRLTEIMEVSLHKSRLGSAYTFHAIEDVDLIPFLDAVIDTAEGLWPDRFFVFSPESKSVAVRVSRTQLKTALLNLLDNACKYSPKDTPITIELHGDGSTAAISVIDQGCGLLHSEINDYFTKFQRGSNSNGTSGAGLGLWLVQKTVESYNGSIALTPGEQNGTIATLHLPLMHK